MGRNFFRRLFGGTENPDQEEDRTLDVAQPDSIVEPQPRIYARRPLTELQLVFYAADKSTVEVLDYENQGNFKLQIRLTLEYYAETLFRLGTNDSAVQLQQYIAALCSHLIEDGDLKRINILGNLMDFMLRPPQEIEPLYYQKAILYQNEDLSYEAELSEPLLPPEYFLPTSMLLLMQNMLYSLDEEALAELFMALSAMHTFYATRHDFTEPEGRRLVVHHALNQLAFDQLKPMIKQPQE